MSARDRILGAVRASLGGQPRDPDAIAAEAIALLASPELVRPALSAPTLSDAFAARASALGTTLDRIAEIGQLPAAVSRYLDAHGLSPAIAVEPSAEFAGLAWGGIRTHDRLAPDEAVAVGAALWGIAESGSLVIHSGPETPILLAFLPLHHILVLQVTRILVHLEDYAAELEKASQMPRNAILITGPSGTTDIEGSYVRGAHGPGYLHVIVVDGAP